MSYRCSTEVKKMQQILDEIAEKVPSLTSEERRELLLLLQEEERKEKSEDGKNPSPNIEWLKANRDEYAGNYVALFEGELIAFGRTIKEADTKAKAKGYTKTFLHYIPAKDEVLWGC